MMLQWTIEENTLLYIKKGIADGWRMNSRQLSEYCMRLQKLQERVLPGYLGSAFMNAVRQIADGQSSAGWPELYKDTEKILQLLQNGREWDKNDWLAHLPVLKAHRKQYFCTALGEAFICTLNIKLGIDISIDNIKQINAVKAAKTPAEQNRQKPSGRERQKTPAETQNHSASRSNLQELEQLASWLMEDAKKPPALKQPRYFLRVPKGAAAAVSACLSLCLLSVWMYGQVKRNQSFDEIQKLKAAAITQQQIYMENKQSGGVKSVNQTDGQPHAESAASSDKQTDAELSAKNQAKASKDLAKKPKILAQYQKMAEEYPGLFGWLQIPDTQIDLPVMQPYQENDFYLHHDFTGAESVEGALFADPENSCWPQDSNTVIYGHNMKNGHIFGTLDRYKSEDFFHAHRKIYFDTIYETGVYEAVAVVKTRILNEDEQGFRYYRFFQYSNKEEFQQCLDFVKQNQMFETSDTLEYGDQILMLSTCEYSQKNGRLVVVARKI